MKNKMMKGAHLSERKCKEIIRLFCEDLTATQIADISGVSRVTINNYLKLIRTHIAKYCEEHNPRYRMAGAFSFMPVHAGSVPAFAEEVLQDDLGWLYGIARNDQKLFVDLLSRQEYDQLQKFGELSDLSIGELFGERQNRYTALVDIGEWKLTKLDTPSIALRDELDEYDLFWSLAKSRLSKFRGLNRSTAYLHVKECEFRYNYKGEDLNKLLTFIISRRPLHYSKASALE
jgi:transposase